MTLFATSSVAQTVLIADKLIDVIDAKVILNPVIMIEDERITDILQRTETLNQSADAHAHGVKGSGNSRIRAALNGVKHASQTLLAGVTTVHHLGADGYADVALRDVINDRDVAGPRMFVSASSTGITSGNCANSLLQSEYEVGESLPRALNLTCQFPIVPGHSYNGLEPILRPISVALQFVFSPRFLTRLGALPHQK